MNHGGRLVIVVLGAAAAVALFIVLRGDDEDATPSPSPSASVSTDERVAPLEIRVPTDGAVIRVPIPRGREVVLVVRGRAGEEIHLHGYDVRRRIGPDGVVRLPFRATIPGRFEVEVEGSHRLIADLTVR